MIAIRSYLPSLLTFPGVVLRQAIQVVMCRLAGVKVLDVRYFRRDTPSGYVLHEMPKELRTSLGLALGPLVVHTILCMALCLPALAPVQFHESSIDAMGLFQLWLGLSIGMHAFPPFRDTNNLWELTRKEAINHGALVRVAFPVLAFIRTAQRLSLLGFDVVYAGAVGLVIPWFVLAALFPVLPGN